MSIDKLKKTKKIRKKILCIIGTRPEVIKMAPVIWQLKKQSWVELIILATAQHREMLDQMLELFTIIPDIDLNIMTENQALPDLTAKLIHRITPVIEKIKPDCILAQGDTTTVFVSALISFYLHIPFGHIEAGLRTHNIYYPFPEEANRVLTSHLTAFHFTPTQTSKKKLLQENISHKKIFVTGNTVIDSLYNMLEKIKKNKIKNLLNLNFKNKKIILVTVHRRENFGENFLNICQALKHIADQFTDIEIIYPVHPNPYITKTAHQELKNHPRIKLIKPLDYLPFINLMQNSYIILTDSGGIQEEAPALGKPVLVLRNETERPEAVKAGVVKIIGCETKNIIFYTKKLLSNKKYYLQLAKNISPYGDGKAAEKIVSILKEKLI